MLYRLKQSPREWYANLTASLPLKGFRPTQFNPCVFIHETEQYYISVYIDNIVIFGAKTSFIDNIVHQLNEEFEVTDLGDATWILGLQITYLEQGITISQRLYIDKILAKFSID